MLVETHSPSTSEAKIFDLEEGAKIIGTCIDQCWLPIKTANQVFLLNLQDQTKIILEADSQNVKKIRCVIALLDGGFVVVSQAKDKGIIKTGKIESNDQVITCQLTDSALTLNGYYFSYEVTKDGHWLHLFFAPTQTISGWEYEKGQNYLMDLTQQPLVAIELAVYPGDFFHANRRIAFISSSHICVLAREKDLGFPIYSLLSFQEKLSKEKTNSVVKMPLNNMVGYLSSRDIESIGTVHPQGFKCSPNGQWLSFVYAPGGGMFHLKIYSLADSKLTLKKTIETNFSNPRWLDDNTIIFQLVWGTSEMKAGIYQYNPAADKFEVIVHQQEKTFTAINSREIMWQSSSRSKTLQSVGETKEATCDKADAAVIGITIAYSSEDVSGDSSLEYIKSFVMWKPIKLSSKQVTSLQAKLIELVNTTPKISYTKSVEEIFKAHQITEAQCQMHPFLYSQIQNIKALDIKSVSASMPATIENKKW